MVGDMAFEGFNDIVWLSAVIAFVATIAIMLLLFPFCHALALVDHPQGRKDHEADTATTGGVAMYLGIAIASLLTLQIGAPLWSFLGAGLLLIVTGWLDDRYDLRWWWRIAIQVGAALILVYGGGVRIEQIGPVFGAGAESLGRSRWGRCRCR